MLPLHNKKLYIHCIIFGVLLRYCTNPNHKKNYKRVPLGGIIQFTPNQYTQVVCTGTREVMRKHWRERLWSECLRCGFTESEHARPECYTCKSLKHNQPSDNAPQPSTNPRACLKCIKSFLRTWDLNNHGTLPNEIKDVVYQVRAPPSDKSDTEQKTTKKKRKRKNRSSPQVTFVELNPMETNMECQNDEARELATQGLPQYPPEQDECSPENGNQGDVYCEKITHCPRLKYSDPPLLHMPGVQLEDTNTSPEKTSSSAQQKPARKRRRKNKENKPGSGQPCDSAKNE